MFGMLALLLQGLAPACFGQTTARANGSFIVICTAHGTQKIAIDANGKPLPDGPTQDQQGSTCLLCTNVHRVAGFVPPSQAALLVSDIFQRAPSPAVSDGPVRAAHLSYVSRAPPFAFA
jgi:Protein of unknown function (DUF2946)